MALVIRKNVKILPKPKRAYHHYLNLAIESGKEQFAHLLIQKGDIDIYEVDKAGIAAIHSGTYDLPCPTIYCYLYLRVYVCMFTLSCFVLLYIYNAIVTIALMQLYHQYTPNVASAEGMMSVVKVLVARNAMTHGSDKWQYSPLHHAITNGHFDVIKHLVEVGQADVNAWGFKGLPLLSVAAQCGECMMLTRNTLLSIHANKQTFTHIYRSFGYSDISPDPRRQDQPEVPPG